MSNIFFFFIFLSLISLQIPDRSLATDTIDTAPWKELHDLETAEFLYRTGDYLSASLSCDSILKNSKDAAVRDQAILLKMLSDLHLRYNVLENSYQIPQGTSPRLSSIFDLLYKSGDYNELVVLSKGSRGSEALYFQGLALYKIGRLEEAIKPLREILEKDEIFPYTNILLMQIMVKQGNLKEGERHLMEIPLEKDSKLGDRVHLLLGYLYLEMGEIQKAEESFLMVDINSDFYRPSKLGIAWAKIKTGMYEEAVSLKDTLLTFHFHDPLRYESMMAIAHCYHRLGKLKEARDWFLMAIEELTAFKNDLKKLHKGGEMHKVYINGIKDGKDMSYMAFFQDDPDITRMVAYLKTFDAIKRKYESREEEVEHMSLSLKERVAAREEQLAKITERTDAIKRLLTILAKRIGAVDKKSLDSNDTKIIERWQKMLNRPLTATETGIIHLLAMGGGSGLWCLNNAIYSPVLCIAPGPGMDGYGNKTSERINNDLNNVIKGKGIAYEERLRSVSIALKERIEYEKRVLKDMEIFKKEKLLKNKDRAQKGIDAAMKLLSDRIDKRTRMVQYETDVLLKKAVTGLNRLDEKGGGR